MTRAQAVNHMRIAGYHNDMVALSILHAGSTISKKLAKRSFRDGLEMRKRGVRCGCKTCKPPKPVK